MNPDDKKQLSGSTGPRIMTPDQFVAKANEDRANTIKRLIDMIFIALDSQMNGAGREIVINSRLGKVFEKGKIQLVVNVRTIGREIANKLNGISDLSPDEYKKGYLFVSKDDLHEVVQLCEMADWKVTFDVGSKGVEKMILRG